MSGITYESIMKMAYNSGRDGSIGADAEIYNRMERMFLAAEEKSDIAGLQNDEQYRLAFASICLNVRRAIERVQERKRTMKPGQRKKLEEISELLRKAVLFDKTRLDTLLEDVDTIFFKVGLQER